MTGAEYAKKSRVALETAKDESRLGVKNRATIDPWRRRRCFDLPLASVMAVDGYPAGSSYSGLAPA
jgi:hypothetical protein